MYLTMSEESGRKKSYDSDLCWRVVYQRIGRGLPYEKIAKNLDIAIGTAHRVYFRFLRISEVCGSSTGHRKECRKLKNYNYVVDVIL